MSNKTGLEIANDFSDFVNNFSHKEKAEEFIEGFDRQHRTLQQSMFRVMLSLIDHMASSEYHTDGRNEQSKKVAKQLVDGFKLQLAKEYREQGVSEERIKDYLSGPYGLSAYLGYI